MFACSLVQAQQSIQPTAKKQPGFTVAIFAPLYLDSAYTSGGESKTDRYTIPKNSRAALEFIEGAQIALDTLNKEKAPLTVYIFDTKSSKETITEQLSKASLNNLSLLITYCSTAEMKIFADEGLKRNITVVNVNLPNDGGVNSNPYFVLMNATLKTQCVALINFAKTQFTKQSFIVFRKKGALEDRIKTYFDEAAKSVNSAKNLSLKYIDLTDSFSIDDLKKNIDSTKKTVCIAGSLDEQFGKRLAQQIAQIAGSNDRLSLVGMPTWEDIKDFKKPEYRSVDIYYGNSFYFKEQEYLSEKLTATYTEKFFVKPSENSIKGFEAIWRFGKLLVAYGQNLPSNFTSKLYDSIRETDLQPVINLQTGSIDYFENKKIRFFKWQDGIITAAN
jgi:hypothetical protein